MISPIDLAAQRVLRRADGFAVAGIERLAGVPPPLEFERSGLWLIRDAVLGDCWARWEAELDTAIGLVYTRIEAGGRVSELLMRPRVGETDLERTVREGAMWYVAMCHAAAYGVGA